MDDLDLKIFRALEFRPFGPHAGDPSRFNPWVIARKVGADGGTVKLRLKKMRESGFIHYFQIYPNLRLLGLRGAAYEFTLPDVLGKDAAIEKASLVDGVTEIHNFIGNHICIDFTYAGPADLDRRLRLFRNLTGCASPEWFYDREMPPVDVALTRTDWRIIQALRYDAFQPLSAVARKLGLSLKTVRRRYERLVEHRAVIIAPLVNPAEIPHTITYVMLLYPSEAHRDRVVQEALETFGAGCFLTRVNPTGNAMLCLVARTLAETEESLVRARRIEGMRDVKLLVLRGIREYTQWIDAAIERQIEDARVGRPSGRVSRGRTAVPTGAGAADGGVRD